MIIDATMRGLLEQYIDSIVIAISNIEQTFFDPPKKAQLQIQMRKICIRRSFGEYTKCIFDKLRSIQARYPNPEEIEEISNIIFKRIPEIRNAIYSAGY